MKKLAAFALTALAVTGMLDVTYPMFHKDGAVTARGALAEESSQRISESFHANKVVLRDEIIKADHAALLFQIFLENGEERWVAESYVKPLFGREYALTCGADEADKLGHYEIDSYPFHVSYRAADGALEEISRRASYDLIQRLIRFCVYAVIGVYIVLNSRSKKKKAHN